MAAHPCTAKAYSLRQTNHLLQSSNITKRCHDRKRSWPSLGVRSCNSRRKPWGGTAINSGGRAKSFPTASGHPGARNSAVGSALVATYLALSLSILTTARTLESKPTLLGFGDAGYLSAVPPGDHVGNLWAPMLADPGLAISAGKAWPGNRVRALTLNPSPSVRYPGSISASRRLATEREQGARQGLAKQGKEKN